MLLSAPELPWLQKAEAARIAREIIDASVTEARGLIGSLEFATAADTVGWSPPASGGSHELEEHVVPRAPGEQPTIGVAGALEFLALHRRAVPSACFVFILSDFLAPPSLETWEDALDRGWEVVPVVIQDPVWEHSFPDIDGILVPLRASTGGTRLVRLRRGESADRRESHEERRRLLLSGLGSLGIEPVLVSSSAIDAIFESFASWSAERQSASSPA